MSYGYCAMPRKFKRVINVIDSSTIQLVANCMDWAKQMEAFVYPPFYCFVWCVGTVWICTAFLNAVGQQAAKRGCVQHQYKHICQDSAHADPSSIKTKPKMG